MSVDTAYVKRSVNGAWRLGLRDAQGMNLLDLTVEGFFRSFYALFLAAPIFGYVAFGQMRIVEGLVADGGEAKAVSLIAFVLFEIASYVGGSIVFLIAMAPISRLIGVEGRYAPLAIAYNWGTLLVQCLYLPSVILFALGLVGAVDAKAMDLIALGFAIYFRFASIRTVLNIPWPSAMALALIDVILQLLWHGLLLELV
jgi:hypothetical protein